MRPFVTILIMGFIALKSSAAPKHKRLMPTPSTEVSNSRPKPFNKPGTLAENAVQTRKYTEFVAPQIAPSPCTLESLSATRRLTSPRLGKNGFFFIAGDIPQLHHRLSLTGEEKRLTNLTSGVTAYGISPEGDSIWLLSGDSRLHLLELEVLHPIEGNGSRPVWSPDGRSLFFTSQGPDKLSELSRVDVDSKKRTKIGSLPYSARIADITPNGRTLALIRSEGYSEERLVLWTLSNSREKTLKSQLRHIETAYFSKDSRALIIHSDFDGRELGLSRHDILKGRETTLISAPKTALRLMSLSPERRSVAVTSGDTGEPVRIERLSDDAKVLTTLANFPSPGTLDSLHLSSGQELYFSYSQSLIPSVIARWNLERMETLLSQGCFDCVPQSSKVYIPTNEGRVLEGWSYPAKLGSSSPPFVYLHDGSSEFRPEFQSWLLWTQLSGFGVLAPNLRGSTGRDRKFRTENRPEFIVADLKDSLSWLTRQGRLNDGSIGILSEKQGGGFNQKSSWELLLSLHRNKGFEELLRIVEIQDGAPNEFAVSPLPVRRSWQNERLNWMGNVFRAFEKKREELRKAPP